MNIKEMATDALIERRKAIATEVDAANGEALDALETELNTINAELETRKAAEAKRQSIRAAIAAGAGNVIAEVHEEKKTDMTLEEVRKSQRYIDAYARYIRSDDDKECRMILTETNPGSVSGSGPVPVPVLVDEIVRTAWDNDEVLSRARRTYFRGNLKVPFERSATAAEAHTEGTTAPSEESLLVGIVTMIPANIKKWIRITDEAATMGGEAFLRYIYDELTYQIVRKLSADVVGDIAGAGTSHTGSAIGIPKVSAAPSLTTVPTATGYLSDEAREPVVIMNRLTYVEFYAAYAAGNFAVDPFAGLRKVYSSALPAYSAADTNAVYAIVGDLSGAQVNYPEGDGVVIKWDDLSEAEADLIKVVGRQFAAHGVTAPGRFVNITKPAAVTT